MSKVIIHTNPKDYKGIRKAGKLAAMVLDHIKPYVVPGVSTLELNDICHDYILSNNAIPAPLNYNGFPKSICTSINNVVCHGIPKMEDILKDGDVVNIDVTVIIDSWHGDTSRTFMVGSKKFFSGRNLKVKKLVEETEKSMWEGIKAVKHGAMLSDIGAAIEDYILPKGFSIVKDYCGHGIGKDFHCEPQVLHYRYNENDYCNDIILKEGMFFTIEPMINIGSSETILSKDDGWTAFTKDGSISAQFEHTLCVTKDGFEVFTL